MKTTEPPTIQHTATPWQVVIEPQVAFEADYPHPLGIRPQTRIFVASDGMTIAELPNDIPGQRWNAALIVRAVNSHADLVAALRGCLPFMGQFSALERAGEHPMRAERDALEFARSILATIE